MIRQDFLLKQIEELGKVLGQILSNLLGIKGANAGRHIEETCQTLREEADLDIDKLLEVPLDKFIQTLQENKAMNDVNLDHFAAVLFHIAENENKDKARLLYERSLIIYNYLENSSVYSFNRNYYLEQIHKSLNN